MMKVDVPNSNCNNDELLLFCFASSQFVGFSRVMSQCMCVVEVEGYVGVMRVLK